MKTLFRILLLALLTLSMVGCDSIFLKKGKGVIRISEPGPGLPPEGGDNPGASLIEVTSEEGMLVIYFPKDVGPVKLVVADRTESTEVWSTLVDSSLGRVEVEIPETLPADTYLLILEDEAGNCLYKSSIMIG